MSKKAKLIRTALALVLSLVLLAGLAVNTRPAQAGQGEWTVEQTTISPNPAIPLRGVFCLDTDHIYFCGAQSGTGGGGAVVYYEGGAWTAVTGLGSTTTSLYAIWASGPNDVFVVGSLGRIFHYNGTSWSDMTSNASSKGFYGVWGSAGNDVFAVGLSGTIVHYNGTSWSAVSSGTTANLYGVWGTGPNDVFAGGGGSTIIHYDGVDDNGDGSLWDPMDSASGTSVYVIRGFWGTGPDDVYAGAYTTSPTAGYVLHYNGSAWTKVYCSTEAGFGGSVQSICGTGNDVYDVYGVGTWSSNGYVAYLHYSPVSSITVDLRATGIDGDIFKVDDYPVPDIQVTEDTYTMDAWTAMGALVYYCQQNSIEVTVQSSPTMGLYVYQIGNNVDDENTWTYTVDETTPWVSGAEYALAGGESVHWANYMLGLYSLHLSVDPTAITVGDSITATVTYTNGEGATVPVETADVYVSNSTDSYGYPATPGTSVGQTNAGGQLTFAWNDEGTFYPYAGWNGKDTVYQWPVVSYTCADATPWDVNGDGTVDVFDMVLVGNHFGETDTPGWIPEDVNSDGTIDVFDMVIIGNHFGE